MGRKRTLILSFLFSMVLLLVSYPVVFAQIESKIYIPNTTARKGADVDISVKLSAQGAAGSNFTIEYNPAELEYKSNQTFLGASANATSSGKIRVTFASTNAISKEETVITVTFKVKENFSGSAIPVKLSEVKVFDVDGKTINVSASNGSIAVSGGTTPPPDVTAKPTTSKVLINGEEVSFDAYNINGSNYFKLSELGEALNFEVDYDIDNNTIIINTNNDTNSNVYSTKAQVPAIKTITGAINQKEQVDMHTYTAPKSGIYQFELISDVPSVDYRFVICDERNTELRSVWLSSQGLSLSLNEGQEYKIYIKQSNGYMNYTVNINLPTITNVSGTQITSSLTRKEQVDVFTYTAPKSGIYQFELTNDVPNGDYRFTICDERDAELRSVWLSSQGLSLSLNEGQKYKIYIRQNNGYMRYTVNINLPTVTNVNGTQITNSLTRKEQVDVYTYTAPKSGIYQFELSNDVPNGDFRFTICDERDAELRSVWLSSQGLSLSLNEGQKYKIYIRQNNGYMRYTVNINLPTVTQVSGTQITNSLTRKEQVDVYTYTAPKSGTYKFELANDVPSGDFRFTIYDEKDNELRSGWLSGKEVSVSLNANQKYKICIRQNNGYMKYTINIKVP